MCLWARPGNRCKAPGLAVETLTLESYYLIFVIFALMFFRL